MAVALIKLTMGTRILEFTPAQVQVIEYNSGENNIRIALVGGYTIDFVTPSPADALAKLTLLETAMNRYCVYQRSQHGGYDNNYDRCSSYYDLFSWRTVRLTSNC
jgi:hypothetical protein